MSLDTDTSEHSFAILRLAEIPSCSVTEFRPPGAEEQEIFSDGSPASRGVWDRCIVTAHFAPDQDVDGPVQASHISHQTSLRCCGLGSFAQKDMFFAGDYRKFAEEDCYLL